MPNGHTTPTPPPAFAPPVPSQFTAHFADAHGREAIVIHNDGHWLRTTIRGVALAGHSLDDFEPVDTPSAADLAQLTLSPQGQLCACELRFDLPLPLTPWMASGGDVTATLQVHLELGAPTAHSLTHERLTLALAWTNASGDEQRLAAQDNGGWFETALLDLQAQLRALPESLSIKACISCQYSDYSPYGNGRRNAVDADGKLLQHAVILRQGYEGNKKYSPRKEPAAQPHEAEHGDNSHNGSQNTNFHNTS